MHLNNIKIRKYFFLILVLLFSKNIVAQKKPNVVVILADDMGYSDIGIFGSEIKTPNLDALGKGGVLFNQFYNAGRCCPSRASLLTGLYPHQAGMGGMVTTKNTITTKPFNLTKDF